MRFSTPPHGEKKNALAFSTYSITRYNHRLTPLDFIPIVHFITSTQNSKSIFQLLTKPSKRPFWGSSIELSRKLERTLMTHSYLSLFLFMNQLALIPNDNEIKMANLRRPSSKDRDIVGWFKPDGRCCKKHPKHRQSPGVCSLCLRDKLSQLSSSRKKTTSANSSCSSSVSSLSSYCSSSSASSCASPMHPFPFATKGKSGSSSVSIFLLSSSKHGLVKSRSMSVFPRRRRRKDGEEGGVDDDHNKKSAKKSGFWFKLLHPKSKRSIKEKETKLVHSRSVREMVTLGSW